MCFTTSLATSVQSPLCIIRHTSQNGSYVIARWLQKQPCLFYLILVPRLRVSGILRPISPYSFMAVTGLALPFLFLLIFSKSLSQSRVFKCAQVQSVTHDQQCNQRYTDRYLIRTVDQFSVKTRQIRLLHKCRVDCCHGCDIHWQPWLLAVRALSLRLAASEKKHNQKCNDNS